MFLICKDTNQVGKSVANLLRMLFVVTSFLNSKLSFLFWIGNISYYNHYNELQDWASNFEYLISKSFSSEIISFSEKLAQFHIRVIFVTTIPRYLNKIIKINNEKMVKIQSNRIFTINCFIITTSIEDVINYTKPHFYIFISFSAVARNQSNLKLNKKIKSDNVQKIINEVRWSVYSLLFFFGKTMYILILVWILKIPFLWEKQ